MSGIMAIVSLDGRPVPPELARAQLSAIAHRGESAPRLWEAPGVALGHVNLPRTPEAEREFLPAAGRDGRYWITWDGRLDNRDELAAELGYDAAERSAQTDAGYVLDAFAKWGDDCVGHLLGDWAVVIWDSQERRLFCAKDPLGWRQLHYLEHAGLFAVGSEPQQFFANGWLPEVVNDEFVLRLVGWAMQETGATCWQGVLELPGGSRLAVNAAGVTADQYWRTPRPSPLRVRTPGEALDAFKMTFLAASEARARTNRPLGVFLSGGLDSSYITAALATQGHVPVPVIGFSHDYPAIDEREYSLAVTGHLGLEPSLVSLDDCWPWNERWMPGSSCDQPYAPPQGSILNKLASTAAAAGVGVVFSGEGGDEFMTGGFPVGADRCISDAVVRLAPRRALRIARGSTTRSPSAGVARACYRELTPLPIQRVLGRARGRGVWNGFPEFVQPSPGWRSVLQPPEENAWSRRAAEAFTWATMRDAGARGTISWRDRHVFAAHRIENRSPFNDLRVVELMSSMPESLKRHSGRPKAILRDAIRELLPSSVADRKGKAEMNPLFDYGLATAERGRIEAAIGRLDLTRVETPGAFAAWDEWTRVRYGASQPIWGLACAALWLQKGSSDRPVVAANSQRKGGD